MLIEQNTSVIQMAACDLDLHWVIRSLFSVGHKRKLIREENELSR